MGAGAVAADQGSDGSGVGPRLIPEEPMSVVLNLGISRQCLLFLFFPSIGFPFFVDDLFLFLLYVIRKLAVDRPDDYDVPSGDAG